MNVLLRANLQIKSARFLSCDAAFLLQINQNLPNLEHLHFRCDSLTFADFQGNDINFPTLKTLDIQLSDRNQSIEIPILCNNLQELKISYGMGIIKQMNDAFVEFIAKQTSIRKFVLYGGKLMHQLNAKCLDSLKFLEEIEFGIATCSAESMNSILMEMKSLKKISAYSDSTRDLEKCVNVNWNLSIDEKSKTIIFERIV